MICKHTSINKQDTKKKKAPKQSNTTQANCNKTRGMSDNGEHMVVMNHTECLNI